MAKYKAADIEKALEQYFREADCMGELYSEFGLAKALKVTMRELHRLHDGAYDPKNEDGDATNTDISDAVKMGYARLAEQLVTDPRWNDRGGASSKSVFLLKQPRIAGYVDKQEVSGSHSVSIKFGSSVDKSCFE